MPFLLFKYFLLFTKLILLELITYLLINIAHYKNLNRLLLNWY